MSFLHTHNGPGDALFFGAWRATDGGTLTPLEDALRRINRPVFALTRNGAPAFSNDGEAVLGREPAFEDELPLHGFAAPCPLSALGDPRFLETHSLRYPLYAGAMANGIGSEALVEAMGRAGMLAFFGAAGLAPARIEAAINRLQNSLDGLPHGFNLINSPGDPAWQEAVADLYIRRGVALVEASAYIALSLPLVRFRVHGIHERPDGAIVAPNRVIAKLSRAEVAERFLSPPPEKMLHKLREQGHLTEAQARLAARIPMAGDVTVEADSGGHTDHRPAITALPAILALRDALHAKHGYAACPRVGLGGGIGAPAAAAAAFAMGAAYVVTGSINQACIESGSSDLVRAMLAQAAQTDVGEAPAADMFESGVTVQVLKKGTRFPLRAAKLYETYKNCSSLEDIPVADRAKLEAEIFRAPLDDIWDQTRAFFEDRDPAQIEKAEKNPRHKMALVFRWYLGQSSRWANAGEADRQDDFQIWCGPAMGAFNEWAAGSYLESPGNRRVVDVAMNILFGAAVQLRAAEFRRLGVPVPAVPFPPEPLDALAAWMR